MGLVPSRGCIPGAHSPSREDGLLDARVGLVGCTCVPNPDPDPDPPIFRAGMSLPLRLGVGVSPSRSSSLSLSFRRKPRALPRFEGDGSGVRAGAGSVDGALVLALTSSRSDPAPAPARKNQPAFCPLALSPLLLLPLPPPPGAGVGETARISCSRVSSVNGRSSGPVETFAPRPVPASLGPVELLGFRHPDNAGSSGPILRRAQRLRLPMRVRSDGDGVGGALGWEPREGVSAAGWRVGGGVQTRGGDGVVGSGSGIGMDLDSGSRSSSSNMSASGGRLFFRRRRPFRGGVEPAA
jgi:hypothetical protein